MRTTMVSKKLKNSKFLFLIGLFLSSGILAVGCVKKIQTTDGELPSQPLLFSTPQEAVEKFQAAVKAGNKADLIEVFGPDGSELLYSGDPVADSSALANFAALLNEQHSLEEQSEDRYELLVGNKQWPFPIPIKRDTDGWYFDSEDGIQEILDRRIGENELRTIRLLRSFVQAQKQYHSKDRDGDGVKEFALKSWSSPGKQDGLFWDESSGIEQSPLGPLVADAMAEGYRPGQGEPSAYHGYFFKPLYLHVGNANRGKQSYLDNRKNLTKGFALLAYPARWSTSGIMTFIVDQEGVVYQKDLGILTLAFAGETEEYNPDSSWEPVDDPNEDSVD